MQASNDKKLLWDDPKFSKLSSSAQQLTGVFAEKLILQAGISQTSSEEPLVILDNACGTGVVTDALQAVLRERPAHTVEVTCGDFADAMVTAAAERVKSSGWTNVTVMKVDAQDTKLPSNHFTHVFTNFGPMLFPNASAMLSECHRMLKSQGICAFTTWKQVGWIKDVREAFNSMPDLPSFPAEDKFSKAFSDGRWFDENYIHDQLTKHGFDGIKIEAIPNRSIFENVEQLRASLRPILSIVYSMWNSEDRQRHGTEKTEKRIEAWFEKQFKDKPIAWDWIALVTTSIKSVKSSNVPL